VERHQPYTSASHKAVQVVLHKSSDVLIGVLCSTAYTILQHLVRGL